jgi:hypothetical protein
VHHHHNALSLYIAPKWQECKLHLSDKYTDSVFVCLHVYPGDTATEEEEDDDDDDDGDDDGGGGDDDDHDDDDDDEEEEEGDKSNSMDLVHSDHGFLQSVETPIVASYVDVGMQDSSPILNIALTPPAPALSALQNNPYCKSVTLRKQQTRHTHGSSSEHCLLDRAIARLVLEQLNTAGAGCRTRVELLVEAFEALIARTKLETASRPTTNPGLASVQARPRHVM